MRLPSPCRRHFLSTTLIAAAFATLTAGFAQTTAPKEIYPAPESAQGQIKAALAKAAKEHKRVLLDFGGNWCGDCKVLDKYIHQEPNASLLKENFILVDVNIGHSDKNKDIAKTYGVPLEKGVPPWPFSIQPDIRCSVKSGVSLSRCAAWIRNR